MRFHLSTAALWLLVAAPGFALDITTEFVDEGAGVDLPQGRDCRDFAVSACDVETVVIENGVPVFKSYAACGHDGDLIDHMAVAAAHWEDILEDDHQLTVHFWWVADIAPTTHVMQTDDDGRPTEAAICFPADLGWYYDPLPGNHDEFQLTPKLYRSLHPNERDEGLDGGPPEVFEVAYNGPRDSGGGLDMLGVALHELGHAVGLTQGVAGDPPVVACTKADPFYVPSPSLVGGADFALKAFEFFNTDTGMQDWDCAHLALGGIKACRTAEQQAACDDDDPSTICPDSSSTELSTFPPYTVGYCLQHQALMWSGQISPASFRQHADTATILAVREAADWEEVDLPRKFSLGTGEWDDDEIWLGGRAPDGGDEVFVVNQLTDADISVFHPASARGLTVTDGNLVRIQFTNLTLTGPAHVRDRLPGADDLIVPAPDPDDDIGVPPEISRLEVDGSSLTAAAVHVGAHGRLDVGFDGEVHATEMSNLEDGEIRGRGLVRTDHLDNRGLIRSNGDALRFDTITDPGGIVLDPPEFDLDGSDPEQQDARLRALTGDLVFDGPIADFVGAEIQVGAGYRLVLPDGWTQVSTFNTDQRLELLGGAVGATVEGPSTLAGRIELQGIGRFTDPASFLPAARVNIDIGGLVPGSDHDQLRFESEVVIGGGTLALTLTSGFLPSFQDEFTLITYSSHTGEFTTVAGIDLENGTPEGLKYFLSYQPGALVLSVGLDGGTPGAPNCQGQAVSHQAQLHGGNKKAAAFHGFDSVEEYLDAVQAFCM